MAKYNIYAGLGGGFGGATYQYTQEYDSQEEANDDAYAIAVEDYESYAGYHGVVSYDEICNRVLEDDEYKDLSEEAVDALIDEMYNEEIENWIESYAVLTSEDDIDEDDLVGDFLFEEE